MNNSPSVNNTMNKPENNRVLAPAQELPGLQTINCIDSQSDFASLETAWNELADNSENSTVFNSWDWLYTWWELYQNNGDRRLFILVCRDQDNALLGIAPFQIIYRPYKYFPCNRQILFLGTGETTGTLVFGEYPDLLIRRGHESRVIDAFSDYLFQHRSRWDGAKFQQLLGHSYLSKMFSAQQHQIAVLQKQHGARTLIRLPQNYNDYLMQLQKKMRNNITRIFSRISKEHEFHLETLTEFEPIETALNRMADMNLNQRGARNLDSVFACNNFVAFHHRLINRLSQKGKILILQLRFAGEPVAVLYSFIDGDTLHVYQSGVKAEYAQRYSLMTTLLTQQIRACIEQMPEISYFNFMFSEDENNYKKRYSSETEPMFDLSFDQRGLKLTLYRWLHGPFKQTLKSIQTRIANFKKPGQA